MLSYTNKVCRWWIQESLFFKIGALRLWVPNSPFDRIKHENVASIGPQICKNDSIFTIWHSIEIWKSLERQKTGRQNDTLCKWSFQTMFPSTNHVSRWWKQETLCFDLEALSLWMPDSSLDKIHDEKVVSIGPQNCQIESRYQKKIYQMKPQTAQFRYIT